MGWVLLFCAALIATAAILTLVRWNPVLIWRIQPMWVWDYVYFAIALSLVSQLMGVMALGIWNYAPPSPRADGLEFVLRNGYIAFGVAYWVWSMRLIKPGD